MAQRTTPPKVRELLEQYDEDVAPHANLQPFIDSAVILADRVSTLDTSSMLSSAALERIECWLSAHFYSLKDRRAESETTGRSTTKFQGKTGEGLRATLYGQAAIDLDLTGTLAALGKKKSRMLWLGTEAD